MATVPAEKTTMRAIVRDAYGSQDALRVREIAMPAVADDEVLVRVRAASVNPVDWHTMTGTPYVARVGMGLLKPKSARLGTDFAGVVEAIGGGVSRFRPGDEVFGARTGAFAEYVSVPEDRGVAPKPPAVTFEQAAAVPVAGITALQGLRDKARLQPGQRLLVNGASGGVGTFAVQIAKLLGAEVTGVCSTRNVEQARSLGADRVVDYTREDFTCGGATYDVLLDIAGSRSWSECTRVLDREATVVIVGGPKTNRLLGPLSHVLKMRLASLRASQKLTFFIATPSADDLAYLGGMLEAGSVTPVIDRRYELSEVPEALAYLGEGHAPAKVVITV
jgi:NADPH:quinone reductase-like Zn-dependent oxidoreductase